jgi:hypothetical protein
MVDPGSAVVLVAGRGAHIVDGAFRRPMILHPGLNDMKIVARAAGYSPATLTVLCAAPTDRRPHPQVPAGVLFPRTRQRWLRSR